MSDAAHMRARKAASLDIATEIGEALDEFVCCPSMEAERKDAAQTKLKAALWDNKAGIVSLLAAFAKDGTAETVAWRWRHGYGRWAYGDEKPNGPSIHLFEVQPLSLGAVGNAQETNR